MKSKLIKQLLDYGYIYKSKVELEGQEYRIEVEVKHKDKGSYGYKVEAREVMFKVENARIDVLAFIEEKLVEGIARIVQKADKLDLI